MKKGDIYYANLTSACPGETNIQYGTRPVILYNNSASLKYSPIVTVIPITTKKKNNLPEYLCIDSSCLEVGNIRPSYVLTGHIRTIDKSCLSYKVGRLDKSTIKQIDSLVKHLLAIS